MDAHVTGYLALLAMAVPVTAIWGNLEPQYITGSEHAGALVHLMEWSYTDITNECASLDWNGYYGIIISPPVEHVDQNLPGWQERYMPISVNNFMTRSGTEEQLKEMIRQCYGWNSLRVFVDLNLNSMLKSSRSVQGGFGYTKVATSTYNYVGIGIEQFHRSCKFTDKKDFLDLQKVYECEVDDCQDVDQDNEVMKGKLVDLLNKLIDLGVYGFRLPFARYINPTSLADIYHKVNSFYLRKPYFIHDIDDREDIASKSENYENIGMVTDYKYGEEVTKYFLGKEGRDLSKLLTWGGVLVNKELRARNKEPLVFLYTHTNQHKLGDKLRPEDGKKYEMAIAFMMAFPYGIPMVLSSYKGDYAPRGEHGFTASPRPSKYRSGDYYYECASEFNCEHRKETTVMMSVFKAEVKERKLTWLEKDEQEHWFAFAREERGFIFINAGSKDQKRTFKKLPLKAGEYCDLATGEIINYGTKCSGKIIVINPDQSTTITLNADDPHGYVAIMSRAWIDPRKVAVANVANYNIATRFFFGLGGAAFRFLGNTAVETVERMTVTFHNPRSTMLHVAAAGVGAVGYKAFTGTQDMIESVGRRAVKNVEKEVTTTPPDVLKKNLEGAISPKEN